MSWTMILGVIAVLGLVALTVHLVLTWFDRRGWVYYRNPKAPKGSWLGVAGEIFQPSVTHVNEQQTLEDSLREDSESGEPEAPD